MAVSSTVGTVNTTSAGGVQGPTTIFPFNAIAITASDSDTYKLPVAVMVTGAGNIVVSPYGGQADITLTVSSAMLPYVLPFMVAAVKSTNTTATGIYGIW